MFEQLLLNIAFFSQIAARMPEVILTPSKLTLSGSVIRPQPPVKKTSFVSPVIAAESALAYDLKSGTLLFQKNIHEKRKIASISKLMTAILILERHALQEKVIIPQAATQVEPVKIWLLAGETMTVENLLYALLIHSGNDAALALAIYDSTNEKTFVEKMNVKAKELGLKNTQFTNATGLDDIQSYSSAYDILLMALESLRYDFIRKAVRIQTMEIRSTDGRRKHKLENTNELLENKNFHIYGLKTGNTLGAGPSLVALADDRKDHEIITIILGSPDRFQETKVLIDWVFRAYELPK